MRCVKEPASTSVALAPEEGRAQGGQGVPTAFRAGTLTGKPSGECRMFTLDTIMTTDVVTIAPTDTVADARRLMTEHRFSHLPVVEGDGRLVGLVTLTDVLAATDSHLREDGRIPESETRIAAMMVTDVATIDERASLRQAALYIERHRIGCLPVVTDGKLVGIVTDTDFVGVAINLLEQLESDTALNESGLDEAEFDEADFDGVDFDGAAPDD